jgi:tRNA(Ile)-lysidine synthase
LERITVLWVLAIEEKVIKTIRECALIPAGGKVLLGLSGGRDSVVLLYVLHALRERLSFALFAAHFNHRIRAEADAEEDFVRDLCRKLGVKLMVGSADIPAVAQRDGLSLEVAARTERHGFFRQSLAELDCSRLALAHHQNDRAETVLLNLMRGSGADGLSAMPARDGNIIRPLIRVTRREIDAYCAEKGLEWREDASNADVSIPRNRIRRELLPYMEQYFNPSVVGALARTAEIIEADEAFFAPFVGDVLSYAQEDAEGVKIPLAAIQGLHPAVSGRVIRAACALAGLERDVESVHVRFAQDLLEVGDTGEGADIGQGFRIVRDAEALSVLYPSQLEVTAEVIPLVIPGDTPTPWGTFHSAVLSARPEDWRRHSGRKQCFSAAKFPPGAVVRTRRPGDSFHPLGAPGSRKLKEYMIDRKIDRRRRDFIPLLCKGKRILWVAGYDMDHDLRLMDEDGEVLEMEYTPGDTR